MALVECPECGRMASEKATVCPGCGYADEAVESAPKKGDKSGPWFFADTVTSQIVGWVLACALYLYTIQASLYSVGMLAHLWSIVVIAALVSHWLHLRFLKRKDAFITLFVVLSVLGLCLSGKYHTWIVKWTNENETRFVDRFRGLGYEHVYRGLETSAGVSSHGPMKGDPAVPHGKWVMLLPEDWAIEERIITQYYWYGVGVEQGEWVLNSGKSK